MELKVKAVAGTLESSDVYVIIEPYKKDELHFIVESTVKEQYFDDIIEIAEDTLYGLGILSGKVTIQDKGALDVVIMSRVQTAALRSAEVKEFDYEELL